MTAIVADKSNSQLIHLDSAFTIVLARIYGESMLHDLTDQQRNEWDEIFKSNNPDAECEVTRRQAARADLEQRLTDAFLSGVLTARAYKQLSGAQYQRRPYHGCTPDASRCW